MRERDPFDEFLRHCTSDMEPLGRLPRTPESLQPIHCADCGEELAPHNRYCSNCGGPVMLPERDENPYELPRREIGTCFEVTILGINQDVTHSGEARNEFDPDSEAEGMRWTEVRLRIANRSGERLCLSLTFAQSALIDGTGRQYLAMGPDDEEESEGTLDGWFYLYPKAWVEGTLLFPEVPAQLAHCYLSCQPQDREEELFHFTLR